MPEKTEKKSKKTVDPRKVKFNPKDATAVKKIDDEAPAKKKISKEVEDLCDSIMAAEWTSWSATPPSVFGYLVLAKWYPKLKSWALLYVAHGHVSVLLNKMFSGRNLTPISHYLTSCNKHARSFFWVKYLDDPHYPQQTVDLEKVISAMGVLYNDGVRPAFNFSDKDIQREPEIPDNFSILDCV